MSNYLTALTLAALAAGTACADDKPAPARPAVTRTGAAPAGSAPAAPAPAGSQAKQLANRPNTGSLTFEFVQAGAESQGAFKQFDVQLKYDEHNLAASSLRVTVQMRSLDTQDKDRDTSLASAELLDSQKFPTATYVASSLAKRGSGLEALGKLTLRGITKDLRVPLTLKSVVNGYELTGEITIKRLDYGVGQGEWESTEWVGNDVKLTYKVSLVESGGARAP